MLMRVRMGYQLLSQRGVIDMTMDRQVQQMYDAIIRNKEEEESARANMPSQGLDGMQSAQSASVATRDSSSNRGLTSALVEAPSKLGQYPALGEKLQQEAMGEIPTPQMSAPPAPQMSMPPPAQAQGLSLTPERSTLDKAVDYGSLGLMVAGATGVLGQNRNLNRTAGMLAGMGRGHTNRPRGLDGQAGTEGMSNADRVAAHRADSYRLSVEGTIEDRARGHLLDTDIYKMNLGKAKADAEYKKYQMSGGSLNKTEYWQPHLDSYNAKLMAQQNGDSIEPFTPLELMAPYAMTTPASGDPIVGLALGDKYNMDYKSPTTPAIKKEKAATDREAALYNQISADNPDAGWLTTMNPSEALAKIEELEGTKPGTGFNIPLVGNVLGSEWNQSAAKQTKQALYEIIARRDGVLSPGQSLDDYFRKEYGDWNILTPEEKEQIYKLDLL